MGGLQLNGVELSSIHAIAWNKITCSKRPDHGFGLNDPMPYGRIDEWVFSYDGRYVTGLWDCDEESKEDGDYGGQ